MSERLIKMCLVVGQQYYLHAIKVILGKVRLVPGNGRANCTIISVITCLQRISIDISISAMPSQTTLKLFNDYYSASAAVNVDSSHMIVSTSTSWSRFNNNCLHNAAANQELKTMTTLYSFNKLKVYKA